MASFYSSLLPSISSINPGREHDMVGKKHGLWSSADPHLNPSLLFITLTVLYETVTYL